MTRPVTLLTVLTVLPLAIFWGASGRAQQEGKTAQLLKMYQECVFGAVQSQIRTSGHSINPSAATEIAFQACRTEEQAISAHGSAGGISPAQANQVIIDYKLGIKQRIRKMFADAERDATQPTGHQAPSASTVEQAPPRPGCRGAYRRYDGEWVYIYCN